MRAASTPTAWASLRIDSVSIPFSSASWPRTPTRPWTATSTGSRPDRRRNTKVLAARPAWLFSSGPLGTEPADAKGRDLRTVTVPEEIPEFTEALHSRGHHVFFGALDPRKLTFAERSLRKLPAARAALPEGDFRDWPEIDDWAVGIARELATAA